MIRAKEKFLAELLDLLTYRNRKGEWQEVEDIELFVSIKLMNGQKYSLWRVDEVGSSEVVLTHCHYYRQRQNRIKIPLKDIKNIKIILREKPKKGALVEIKFH